MRIVAITQARTGSSRFPEKILKKAGGEVLLLLHLKRILKSKKIDELIVATTIDKNDARITALVAPLGLYTFHGSVDDVLDRFYQALKGKNADYVVRLTSDCPLIDAELIDKIIEYTIEHNLDYCSNTLDPNYPDGQDVEVFRYNSLVKAWDEAKQLSEREHVTPYIWKNSSYKGGTIFKSDNFKEKRSYANIRMTVDEPGDLALINRVIEKLGTEKSWLEYAEFLEKSPEIRALNESISRNEGYIKSVKTDNL
jgi:spore coat polysaccharide biosynthesis protein SpsF